MDLHGKIMNLQPNKRKQNKAIDEAMKTKRTYHEILCHVYACGHRDARHDAAELAVNDER